MRYLLKPLAILLLLLVAQQGAVVHELGHVAGVRDAATQVVSGVVDKTCVLCPAFAQAASPAFSHAFHIPSLVRTALHESAEPLYAAISAAVPQPRSRGPPA